MADLGSLLEHVGQSLPALDRIESGFAYLLGIVFFWAGLKKLKTIADSRSQGGGGARIFVPIAYFLGGSALIFLPTMVSIAKNTVFGSDSPIAYTSWIKQIGDSYGNTTYVTTTIIKLAGVMWFIRGTIMLVESSEPSGQDGAKGLAFLVGGIIAINIDYTYTLLSELLRFITVHTM